MLPGLVAAIIIATKVTSAESEHEPAANQAQILQQAITVLQDGKVDQLRSYYDDKEKTSYYLRDASFLGRVQTPSGYQLVFSFTFLRSSPYRDGAVTPPRGHTFAVVFDNAIHCLWWHEADKPGEVSLVGTIVRSKFWEQHLDTGTFYLMDD